jgi:NAD-dependent protein deacetylase/lipoamidase
VTGLVADIARARTLVADAERVLVLTGAGISAESGVPTFRGPEGLWKSFRPETLATPEAFARDPRLVWEWYGWRRARVAACAPNAAHLAIARFAQSRGAERPVTIATQNVDGLHRLAAGGDASAAPSGLLELHGSLFRVRCTRCAHRPGGNGVHHDTIDASSVETLPRCERCGALLRPDIVWFGEALDPAVLGEAWAEAERADVCLVIGTSAVVYPAAGLADVTRQAGGAVIEVNPEPTPLTAASTVSLRSTATAAVPSILGA